MTTVDVSKSRIFLDLVEFSKLHPKLVLERCKYSVYELAILWNKKKNIDEFYKTNELYLYDLTRYQLKLESNNIVRKMIEQMKELKLKKVLEFGGGIGEFSIMGSENNLDVSYFDLDGVIKIYAKWRFNKHNSKIKIIEKEPLNEEWDCVNIMDVLEHMEKPQEVIEQLKKKAKYIFCNPGNIQYNIFYPQHISRFDLTGFEKISAYLWKNSAKTI